MAKILSSTEIESFLAACQPESCQWIVRDGKLCTALKFATFMDAFSFMTSVALYAESHDHHPEWCNVYNRLEISLTTHDAGGITDNDIDLARYITRIYARHAHLDPCG